MHATPRVRIRKPRSRNGGRSSRKRISRRNDSVPCAMPKLELTLACGRYDRTQALIDGRVQPEGVDLTFIPLRPGETFWRMLNHGEFDVSEMSLSSYTILRSEGDTRFTAIPVFPSRTFRHSALYVLADSAIERPQDLRGRRVGVGDYQMTAAVWVRRLLMH